MFFFGNDGHAFGDPAHGVAERACVEEIESLKLSDLRLVVFGA
ncbi:MAG TPA: hypothetical protein VFU73_12725 [Actinocrinis sp.]|nr:hypothetical protein [Actinocrinis sp.]